MQNTIQELRSKADDLEELEKMANERFKGLVSVLQRKFNPQPSDYEVLYKVIPESLVEFRLVKIIMHFLCRMVWSKKCLQDLVFDGGGVEYSSLVGYYTLSVGRSWHCEASSSGLGRPFYWHNIVEDLNLQGVLFLIQALQLHCLKVLAFSTTSFQLI